MRFTVHDAERFSVHEVMRFHTTYPDYRYPNRLLANSCGRPPLASTAVVESIDSWYNRRRPNRRDGGIPPAVALDGNQTRVQKSLPRDEIYYKSCQYLDAAVAMIIRAQV